MSKRIFFFDIDGTICKYNKVSPRVKKAIHNIQSQGDLCFVASGRPLTFLQDAIKDIGFDGYLLFNGAYALYNNEVLLEKTMNEDDVKDLLNSLKELHCEYILQNATRNYIHKDFHRLFDFFKDLVKVDVSHFIREFDESEVIKHILKVEIWPDNPKASQLLIERFPHFKWHQYETLNMEICIEGVSKANGIKKIIEYFHIDMSDTYCFGDGPNDVEMFETIENSYVMDNADDEVKKHAKYICPSIDDDGVAVILEKLQIEK